MDNSTADYNTTAPAYYQEPAYPKALFIAIGVCLIILIAIVIERIAEAIYKRGSIRDDASDISEHTKEILRRQLKILDDDLDDENRARRFVTKWINRSKKTKKEKEEKLAKEALNKWIQKTREHRQTRVSDVEQGTSSGTGGKWPGKKGNKIEGAENSKTISEDVEAQANVSV